MSFFPLGTSLGVRRFKEHGFPWLLPRIRPPGGTKGRGILSKDSCGVSFVQRRGKRGVERTGHNARGSEWANKPWQQTRTSWKPTRREGFASEAPAERAVAARGGKFPLDRLPDPSRAEYPLSIRRVAALTPQQRQGWRFRQQRNNFISHFPCSEGDRQRPWLRGGYSEVTPGSRARRSPRAVVASQLLFVREGKVLFALPALPRESAESCLCPGSPRAGIAFRECFSRGLGQSRGFWVLGEL